MTLFYSDIRKVKDIGAMLEIAVTIGDWPDERLEVLMVCANALLRKRRGPKPGTRRTDDDLHDCIEIAGATIRYECREWLNEHPEKIQMEKGRVKAAIKREISSYETLSAAHDRHMRGDKDAIDVEEAIRKAVYSIPF